MLIDNHRCEMVIPVVSTPTPKVDPNGPTEPKPRVAKSLDWGSVSPLGAGYLPWMVARFHVTALGVTTYFPAYVAVSPYCQSDSSDPFWFSSLFFVCFSNKSEILSLVSIPFKMVSAIPEMVPS
eukprot:scaffold86575_cov62-Attheya_sp.AAC.2